MSGTRRFEPRSGVVAGVARDQQTVRLKPAELEAMARHSAATEEPTDHTSQTIEMVPLVAVIDSIIEAMDTVALGPVAEEVTEKVEMVPLAPAVTPVIQKRQARGSAPRRRERATKRSREILRVEEIRGGGSGRTDADGGGGLGGDDR